MPARLTAQKPTPSAPEFDEFDDVFGDDDPFASPSPDAGKNKRKQAEVERGPGLDEEVEVTKRARVPRVKLDEERLLSVNGIPKLRRKAKDLKLKGKGHEWSDAARLLSFYQLWLDDLFPKAKFLDALGMVEKAGHKTAMHKLRMDWINEGKPRPVVDEEEDAEFEQPAVPKEPTRIAPIFEAATSSRAKTPAGDDIFGDIDIYDATPRRTQNTRTEPAVGARPADQPSDDDLDALMAEADAHMRPAAATQPTFSSIFGSGKALQPSQPAAEPDEDDMDALIAEAEANTSGPRPDEGLKGAPVIRSIFGGSMPPAPVQPAPKGAEDDLDALIAESEMSTSGPTVPAREPAPQIPPANDSFADEEEAMAEMDGLW